MSVTAADVKRLREMTGAGMMDCKTALVAVGGDITGAERKLKEMGLAAAAKRAGRTVDQGRVFVRVEPTAAAILELSSETDFVARNDTFVDLGERLLKHALDNRLQALDAQMQSDINEAVGRIKENIEFRRCAVFTIGSDQHVADYIHGEGAIGVLVKVESEQLVDEVRAAAHDLALHVAAFAPRYLSQDDVDPTYRNEQEQIFKKQAEQLGKPQKVQEGIIKGKLGKHLSEICLLEQGFVKDEKRKVKKMLEDLAGSTGNTVRIAEYRYFKIGDGD